MESKKKIKVIPLGGLGEVGKNITVIEYGDEIIVIDCGMTFPDTEMYGIDIVIPDVSYLVENIDRVKGFFITHGHEDHIGAIPYILKQVNVPIFATQLTAGLIESKLEEHKMLDKVSINIVKQGDIVKLDKLKVEFIRTNHSIADSCALAIHTPIGIVVHTGDFKVDFTPVDGKVIDLQRFAKLGKQGVLLLMADSTNACHPGYTMSEKSVGEKLDNLFSKGKGRIIVATFASNIHRLQQIINSSIKYGRKIAFSGRSMEKISEVAGKLGYLDMPEGLLIDLKDLKLYNNNQITIVTTGSQGEPMSALTRIASSTHKSIQIEKDDMIIISASPIPGNEKAVSKVINELTHKGAEVIYKSIEEIHVSGHACEQELKLIHSMLKPKYFVPVHGEYKHLKAGAKLAETMGVQKDHIMLMQSGDILTIGQEKAEITGQVPHGCVMVDGLGVGDVGNIVLRDRQMLSQNGLLIVVLTLEKYSNQLLAGPDIVSRGFVYVRESESLMEDARRVVSDALDDCLNHNISDWSKIKNVIRDSLGDFLWKQTKRNPMILPIIMEV